MFTNLCMGVYCRTYFRESASNPIQSSSLRVLVHSVKITLTTERNSGFHHHSQWREIRLPRWLGLDVPSPLFLRGDDACPSIHVETISWFRSDLPKIPSACSSPRPQALTEPSSRFPNPSLRVIKRIMTRASAPPSV
jgi:hypothetical protein